MSYDVGLVVGLLGALDLFDLSDDVFKFFALALVGLILHHSQSILKLVESLLKNSFGLIVLHAGSV